MSTRQPEHSALHWWSAPRREYYLAQMWRQSSYHTEAPQCPIETIIRPNLGSYHCSYSYLPLASLPNFASCGQPAPCDLRAVHCSPCSGRMEGRGHTLQASAGSCQHGRHGTSLPGYVPELAEIVSCEDDIINHLWSWPSLPAHQVGIGGVYRLTTG